MNLKHLLHGGSKHETFERYIILGIVVGIVLLGTGIASTAIVTQGVPTILALVGSFITSIFTIILVFYWLFKGDKL